MYFLKKLAKKLIPRNPGVPVTILPEDKHPRGRVLFSYISQSAQAPQNSTIFNGHSNQWESREIINIFNRFGYIVDVIDWNNSTFYPDKHYDVVFDIYTNLQRLTPFLDTKTKKILHLTGSYAPYQNKAEIKRVEE
ncbi:hypothetical protein KAU11_02280, partial [Candidatus Babeliales bacterium]|nr:hypothetical protein [Candidatus Babeliales bacterium]